jgi:hypothetical protein
MRKLILFVLIVLSALGCKEDKSDASVKDSDQNRFEVEKLPVRTNVNAKAKTILKDWQEFNAFNTSFDALYKVENVEDLSLVLEDLIETQKQLEESIYPESFDLPQVKSRQKVLKTFILKTSAAVQYRINATEPAIDMMEAYNALRNQFNIIVNNTLDINLIIDE